MMTQKDQQTWIFEIMTTKGGTNAPSGGGGAGKVTPSPTQYFSLRYVLILIET